MIKYSLTVITILPLLSLHAFEFTPGRNSIPPSASIQITAPLNDTIEFWFNRGKGSVSFKERTLSLLDPNYIKSLPGFKSFKNTRLDFSVYEFRLFEALGPIEALVKKGVHIRFIADPSTFVPFKPHNARQLLTLSAEQKRNYIRAYDTNNDGIVDSLDAQHINDQRLLAVRAWEELQKLKQSYPNQVDLVHPPQEAVSQSILLNFPRLHHLKDISIDFLKEGTWVPQVSLRSSANLTDSCMNKRVATSLGNRKRYSDRAFDSTNYAKGSQGNVQFGALLKGAPFLESFQKTKETWISLYKKKKHFDEGELDKSLLPRIVIEDPVTGHRSTLDTFYSEGTKATNRKSIDPVLAATYHLAGPENTLRVYYSTQFVSTHATKNQALRYLIDKAGSKMEDLFVVVDANFATEPFSTLPHLTFAPHINSAFASLPGKTLRDLPALPKHLDWEQNIGVYEGGKDVYGAPGDKLHAKVDYYEYDSAVDGKRHYLVVWGSANSSKNASRGNADVLHLLDTTDPAVGKTVKAYFKGLRQDDRVFPYSLAYLDKRFREAFNWDQRILNENFLVLFSQFLSGHPQRGITLSTLIENLKNAKAHSEFGSNLIKTLEWYDKYAVDALSWSDFYILVTLAQPHKKIPDSLVKDLGERWLKHTEPTHRRSLNNLVKRLKKTNTFGQVSINILRILRNCSHYLSRLGIHQKFNDLTVIGEGL